MQYCLHVPDTAGWRWIAKTQQALPGVDWVAENAITQGASPRACRVTKEGQSFSMF